MSIFKKALRSTDWDSSGVPSSSSSGSRLPGNPPASSKAASMDFTRGLRDKMFYKPAHLRSLGLLGEITCLAHDPILSLLAIGTSTGLVHLVGSPAFQCTLNVNMASRNNEANAALGIKHLHCHSGLHRIIAIDTRNTLHVWNTGPGEMDDLKNLPHKELTASLYGDVVHVQPPSPTSQHLFMIMRDGNTLAYDLQRHNVSPYKIPNCWATYEEKLRRSGVLGRARKLQTPEGVCLAMCPNDMSQLLIGYEGGVVLWDIRNRQAAKYFEMVLPPGSPGGASYADNIIWSERMPPVTSIAWRPDGLVFAVGHDDGCISFWSIDDPDKPLMVRTIEREDVNVADAESLFNLGALDNQLRSADLKTGPQAPREPIFKLTWVGFPDEITLKTMMTPDWAARGNDVPTDPTIDYATRNETILVVLGGTSTAASPAITLLQMPPYRPPPPRPALPRSPAEGLSLIQRTAFRDSFVVSGVTHYYTPTPAEDYILLPRSNPFWDLSHDPIAIVILTTPHESSLPPANGPVAKRSIKAFTFPPPRSDAPPLETGRREIRTIDHEIESVVPMTSAPMGPSSPNRHFVDMQKSSSGSGTGWRMPWSSAPASPSLFNASVSSPGVSSAFRTKQARSAQGLRLPAMCWTGETAVLGSEIFPLENAVFRQLISHAIESEGRESKPRLPIRGGTAVPDLKSNNAPDPIATKLEKYRVMITWSLDGAVRFWDLSQQILVLPSPLRFEYPTPLPHLTVSITNILKHPSLAHTSLAQTLVSNPSQVRIEGVRFATESNELCILMRTGEVFVYKFEVGQPSRGGQPDLTSHNEYFPEQGASGAWEEVVALEHLADRSADGFKPKAMFDIKRGTITAASISDVGFLAVAYDQNSVAIIDLRGPDVILREGFNAEGRKVKRKRKSADLPAEGSICRHLTWSICHIGGQGTMAPRLIALYAKGLTKIFSLNSVLGEWVPESKTVTFNHDSLARPLASYVLDVQNGAEIACDRDRLVRVMTPPTEPPPPGKLPRCIWVAASARTVRCHLDFTGERLSKYELPETEEFVMVRPVTKNGNRILVCVKRSGIADILSLPALEPIETMRLDFGVPGRPLGRLSFDSSSGDFLEFISPMEVYLRTIFGWKKPLLPRLEPYVPKHAVPAAPIPVSYTWGAWMRGQTPLTGPQLDSLVAGPNRPPVPQSAAPKRPPAPLITWGEVPEKTYEYKRPTPKEAAKRSNSSQATRPQRTDVYEDMTQAARERGDVLEGLEERMESMAESAWGFAKTARNAAMKESGKLVGKSMLPF